MSENLSYSEIKLTKEQFKKVISIVENYKSQGGEDGKGSISPSRYVYIEYPSTEKYILFEKYAEMKQRWDQFKKTNGREPAYIWIANTSESIDISSDDKILPIDTFLDMEIRVNQYLTKGGSIDDNRRIYLKMVEMKEYITYLKYQEVLARVNVFRANNGRNPNHIYLKVVTNDNNSTRKNAVGDDITPNSGGWYLSPRYKTTASAIKQETSYWCGPNSVQQTWYELTGNWYKESTIAKYAGTTTNGTGHSGLETAIRKLASLDGVKVNIKWDYLSSIGYTKFGELVKNSKVGVFLHSKYKLKWGHYEYIIGVNPTTKKILVANSLSGGWLEYRSFATMNSYVAGVSQKSVCEVTLLS